MVFPKNANATNNINLIRYFFAKIRINCNLNGYSKKIIYLIYANNLYINELLFYISDDSTVKIK